MHGRDRGHATEPGVLATTGEAPVSRTGVGRAGLLPCVVCVHGDIYPGCLGPYRLSGGDARNMAAACALPEALVPLILRKNTSV